VWRQWDDDKRSGTLPAGTEHNGEIDRGDLHVALAERTGDALRERLDALRRPAQHVYSRHVKSIEQGGCHCSARRRRPTERGKELIGAAEKLIGPAEKLATIREQLSQ